MFGHQAIVQKAGDYYDARDNSDPKHTQKYLLFGQNTVFGNLIESVDKGKLKPDELWVFFDFDSTLVVKKEETPEKKALDGQPRGADKQKIIPKDFHDTTNMLFVLQALNERNIPWAILTARPDEKHQGINILKKELVKSGVAQEKLMTFLSPTFQKYKIDINDKLLYKFKQYLSSPKSRKLLWHEGEISEFKLNNHKHPTQDGNIILMAHIPKSWSIYYLLQKRQEKQCLPRFVVFVDDSKSNIIKMKDSINNKAEILKNLYPIIDLAPLNVFARQIQFVLIHYARQSNQLLPNNFFNSDARILKLNGL